MKKIILSLGLLICSFCYSSPFVRVKEGQFYRGDSPYTFVGANFWQATHLAQRNLFQLQKELDLLKASGITNLRILALSEGPDTAPYRVNPALISSPGQINENLFVALDQVLVEMNKRNMTAILVLSNFWPWSGGFAQWVSWYQKNNIPYPPPHPRGSWSQFQDYASRFYTIPEAVNAQQKVVAGLVGRINSVSRKAYIDDPTIMAWQLANEPRGGGFREEFLQWISSSAKLIKSLDPNHLVSLGSEGDTPSALFAGNHFINDHSLPEIDYTTIHIWVENWNIYDPKNPMGTHLRAQNYLRNYIRSHLERSRKLGKPMVLEEFGMARDSRSMDPNSGTYFRDLYFRVALEETYQHLGQGMSGINFWAWSGESRPPRPGGLWRTGDALLGDPAHEEQGWYGVYNSDTSTLELMKEYAEKFSLMGHHH
jgi:mannan endo-1,4-beta-mannosidase